MRFVALRGRPGAACPTQTVVTKVVQCAVLTPVRDLKRFRQLCMAPFLLGFLLKGPIVVGFSEGTQGGLRQRDEVHPRDCERESRCLRGR